MNHKYRIARLEAKHDEQRRLDLLASARKDDPGYTAYFNWSMKALAEALGEMAGEEITPYQAEKALLELGQSLE
jgi:hypothetical protein